VSYDVDTPTVARLWRYAPDWSRGFDVKRSYLTDIITSRDGTEQRRATRDQPRLSADYRTVVSGDARRASDHHLRAWQDKPVVVPDFARWARLTDASLATTDTLTISPVPVWASAGQPLVLCADGVIEEVVVASVAGTTITLEDPLEHNWASGDVLRPTFFGLFDGRLTSSRLNRDAAAIDVHIDCYPGGEPARTTGSAWAGLGGIEVFTPQPDYASAPSVGHIWPIDKVDYERGRTAQFRPILRYSRTLDAEYNGLGLTLATQLEQFFDRMKGRRGAFYLPTWEQDFVLADTPGSGSTTFLADGPELANDFASTDYSAVNEGVAVCLTSGTTLYRRITDIAASGLDTLVTVNAAWGVALSSSNVARVSRMNLSRFASDDMVTSWRTPLTAGARLSFQQVYS
jgi:hypothetical protein